METFHILHLASCWDIDAQDDSADAPPIPHAATSPSISPTHAPSTQTLIPDVATSSVSHTRLKPPPRIRAAAAQMVFASRTSQDFISPEQVASIEAWTGRAVLDALAGLPIDPEVSAARFRLTGGDDGAAELADALRLCIRRDCTTSAAASGRLRTRTPRRLKRAAGRRLGVPYRYKKQTTRGERSGARYLDETV